MGEPVPGAEILVEQEPNDVPIQVAPGVTNNEGEVSFTIPPDQFKKLPDKFQLKVTIRPNDPTKYVLTKGAKNTMIFKINSMHSRASSGHKSAASCEELYLTFSSAVANAKAD